MKKSKKTHYYKPSTKTPRFSLTQKIIIGIIIAVMIIVAIAVLCTFLFSTENITKSKIENLATSYYEDKLYDKFVTANGNTDVFKKYDQTGLPPTPLRHLIYTGNLDKSEIEQIRELCDENKTSVKYFPEPPYTKTSYRVEYTYNCEWD